VCDPAPQSSTSRKGGGEARKTWVNRGWRLMLSRVRAERVWYFSTGMGANFRARRRAPRMVKRNTTQRGDGYACGASSQAGRPGDIHRPPTTRRRETPATTRQHNHFLVATGSVRLDHELAGDGAREPEQKRERADRNGDGGTRTSSYSYAAPTMSGGRRSTARRPEGHQLRCQQIRGGMTWHGT